MRRYMLWILLFIISSSVVECVWGAQKELSVYVVAHVDDWQLFMGNDIASDLRSGRSVLLIQTILETNDKCWIQASLASLIMAVDGQGNSQPPCSATSSFGDANCKATTINGHRMQRCQYKNAVAYFLGLPAAQSPTVVNNESLEEEGFSSSGNQTLKKLQKGLIEAITTIDGSAKYNGFDDVVTTISKIVDIHKKGARLVAVHAQDPDVYSNPIDHKDHTTTGCAVATAFISTHVPLRFYVGYSSKDRPANLGEEDEDLKRKLFKEFGRVSGDPNRFSGSDYDAWVQRTILRNVDDSDGARRVSGTVVLYNGKVGQGVVLDLSTHCERKYFGWRSTWSELIATRVLTPTKQFLFYGSNPGNGTGALVLLGKKYQECTFDQWQAGWSVITPVDFTPTASDTLLFYDGGSGEATVRKIASCTTDVPISMSYPGWRHQSNKWTSIIYGSFVGREQSDVLLYDPASAEISVQYLPPPPPPRVQ